MRCKLPFCSKIPNYNEKSNPEVSLSKEVLVGNNLDGDDNAV